MKNLIFSIKALCCFFTYLTTQAQTTPNDHKYQTYCNPVDIDYTYMSHYAFRGVSYRSGADPAVINFKNRYYMFVTRSHGYWVSDDMSSWEFIKPQSWYFNASNAPAAAGALLFAKR